MKTNLGQLRVDLKLTQEGMARRLKVSKSTYTNWEYELRTMSVKTALRIADELDVTLDYLFCRTPDKKSLSKALDGLSAESIQDVYEFIDLKKLKEDTDGH